jgi:hypothetical protein
MAAAKFQPAAVATVPLNQPANAPGNVSACRRQPARATTPAVMLPMTARFQTPFGCVLLVV